MINKFGELRCDNCSKKLGFNLEGRVEIVCPKCKYYNIFEKKNYSNHKLTALDKQ